MTSLPSSESEQPHGEQAPQQAGAPQSGGLRVLVVDDNTINRTLAAGLLARRGHSPVQATNGREAVEAAASEAFDLIFMDVQMPEVDGFEATRRIRDAELATGRHTPIAALTAHTLPADRERCFTAGMDHHLSKPLDKAALIALLGRISASRPNRQSGHPHEPSNL
jgi:two-component system sensor histidine kinase/response regulator